MTGPGEILRLVRTQAAVTRAELGEATGLSRVTIGQRVDALLAAGLIAGVGSAATSTGRRPTRFAFEPRSSLVLAVSMGVSHATLAVVDAHGRILHRVVIDAELARGPGVALAMVLDGLEALLADASIDASEVGAVALCAPGPVDPETHRFNEPPVMPGWNGWPVIETVQERFPVPVTVENDADAMAFGEWRELGADGRPFVLVKISHYIGAGIVIGGRIFRGLDGGAGDIGHVHVGGDARCRCGRVGCLAAEASGSAIVRELHEAGVDVATVPDVVERAATDPIVHATVQRAGEHVGTVLASLVAVLNPATIVVAGSLASAPVIAGIRKVVYSESQSRATRHLDIVQARLGPDAALAGLAAIATDALFDPVAVDARLDA